MDKVPNLDKIPNYLGSMVIEDDQMIHSAGELENNDEIRKLASKIAYTAAKVPVNPEQGKRDSFKRISMVVEDQYVYMITIANRKIFIVKRKHISDENQNI